MVVASVAAAVVVVVAAVGVLMVVMTLQMRPTVVVMTTHLHNRQHAARGAEGEATAATDLCQGLVQAGCLKRN